MDRFRSGGTASVTCRRDVASAHLDPWPQPSLCQHNMFTSSQNGIVKDSTMIDVGHDYVCFLLYSSCLIWLKFLISPCYRICTVCSCLYSACEHVNHDPSSQYWRNSWYVFFRSLQYAMTKRLLQESSKNGWMHLIHPLIITMQGISTLRTLANGFSRMKGIWLGSNNLILLCG